LDHVRAVDAPARVRPFRRREARVAGRRSPRHRRGSHATHGLRAIVPIRRGTDANGTAGASDRLQHAHQGRRCAMLALAMRPVTHEGARGITNPSRPNRLCGWLGRSFALHVLGQLEAVRSIGIGVGATGARARVGQTPRPSPQGAHPRVGPDSDGARARVGVWPRMPGSARPSLALRGPPLGLKPASFLLAEDPPLDPWRSLD